MLREAAPAQHGRTAGGYDLMMRAAIEIDFLANALRRIAAGTADGRQCAEIAKAALPVRYRIPA
jgi:hypothetical protein